MRTVSVEEVADAVLSILCNQSSEFQIWNRTSQIAHSRAWATKPTNHRFTCYEAKASWS